MHLIDTLIIATLILAVVTFVVLLAYRITVNVRTGLSYYDAIDEEISRLRMGKLMKSLDIDVMKYTHSRPLADINDHMRNCRTCKKTQECDDRLESNDIDIDNIDYCTNESVMTEQRKAA